MVDRPLRGRRGAAERGYEIPFRLLEPLSRRECQMLELLALGLSNQAIADRSFVSVNTVKYHLKNLYSKLAVESRFEAVCSARRMGLV